MKVTLLTGFLGAGKTTTLSRIIRDHNTAKKFGVIVNDLSDLEVDGELIRNGDFVSEKDGTLDSPKTAAANQSKIENEKATRHRPFRFPRSWQNQCP